VICIFLFSVWCFKVLVRTINVLSFLFLFYSLSNHFRDNKQMNNEQHESQGDLGNPGKKSSSCSTSGTWCATHVKIPVICHILCDVMG